jgi:hypothetical protein
VYAAWHGGQHREVAAHQRPGTVGMSRDPRLEHLQRLHRQRRLRAAGQSRAAGQMLIALLLVSIILAVLLTVPGQADVGAWVHQLNQSPQVDRVGMVLPTDGR